MKNNWTSSGVPRRISMYVFAAPRSQRFDDSLAKQVIRPTVTASRADEKNSARVHSAPSNNGVRYIEIIPRFIFSPLVVSAVFGGLDAYFAASLVPPHFFWLSCISPIFFLSIISFS